MPRRPYPPMTHDELREISRAAPSPTVKRLLWEIKRLRAVEARVGEVLQAIKSPGPTHPTTMILIQTLEDALVGKLPGMYDCAPINVLNRGKVCRIRARQHSC